MMKRRDFNKSVVMGLATAMMPAVVIADGSARPRISGPVTGGKRAYPFTSYMGDIRDVGYVEEEYFIDGKATNYQASGELSPNGKWTVVADTEGDYRTRFLVRRPADSSRFNGTVLVEWLNVTLGHDIEVTGSMSESIYDSGCVYVLASCQRVGVEGAGETPQGLKQWDPDRYGSLNISGDSYSFDIFTQVGRAVGPQREFAGVDPLAGLKPTTVLATGASQSAGRLRGYINAVHPIVNVYHGFLPTIDFGMSFGFDDFTLSDPAEAGARPRFYPTVIRDDIETPVIVVNSETECLMYFRSRQPDSRYFRYWEVAGASHAPAIYARKLDAMRERDGLMFSDTPTGSVVPWEASADSALLDLIAWAQSGKLPPEAPKIEVKIGEMPEVVRDEFGNAVGGIRLPEVEVPVATHTAAILGFNSSLGLRGTTVPFSDERLRELYPSRAEYVAKVTRAAKAAEEAGFIEAYRVAEYIEEAERTPLGR